MSVNQISIIVIPQKSADKFLTTWTTELTNFMVSGNN